MEFTFIVKMPRLVLICGILYYAVLIPAGLADVKSCYACAGPRSICVANNRTDFLKMDCTTFQVEGQSLLERTAQPNILEKFDSEIGSIIEEADIGCITLTFKHDSEDPQDRALKSCIPEEVFDQDICDYMETLASKLGGTDMSCSFCKEDDCNSAISFFVVRSTVFVLPLILLYCSYFCFEYNLNLL